MTTISSQKHALRGKLMDMRDGITQDMRFSFAEAATKHALNYLLPLSQDTVVALYWPVQNEIDVRLLLNDLERRGIRVALPVVITPDSPLEFRVYSSGDELESGVFNTSHPLSEAPRISPDIMVVPGLAYDRDGYRIGYGGGFYDRTLSLYDRTKAIGFAYAGQIIDYVPRADHDRRLDTVITNDGVIEING